MTQLILANPLFSLIKNSVGASPGKVGVRFFFSEISVLALEYLCSDKTQETLDLGLEVEMTDASEKLGFEGGGWRQARGDQRGKWSRAEHAGGFHADRGSRKCSQNIRTPSRRTWRPWAAGGVLTTFLLGNKM